MSRRDLAALVTVVVAVPGLAVAQQATDEDPPAQVEQTETEAATETVTDEPTDDGTEGTVEAETETEGDTARLPTEEEEEEPDVDATGHGELLSTLAGCLPSGRDLHGTGWTKGAIVSQVASTGTFTVEDGTATEVATPEDARALCGQVQAMVDAAEEPESARGRPSWAGSGRATGDDSGTVEPEDDEPDAASEDRGGPPAHAPAKGRRGR